VPSNFEKEIEMHGSDENTNGLSNGAKLWLTLWIAVLFPMFISVMLFAFTRNLTVFGISAVTLTAYSLIFGFSKNAELEQSVGGLFGQLTQWVIPPGISFWIPPPFGQRLQKVSTAPNTLDRSTKSGKPYVQVKTRDGGLVEVGVVKTWHIVDARKAGKFTRADLDKQVDSLTDRNVRFFALYFDSDEDIDAHRDTALSGKKIEFSRFLAGDTTINDRDGNVIPNDTITKAAVFGVKIDNVDVTDVNEPAEVQVARNRAAAERGQAEAEKLDVGSIRNRILELMWGTSDPTEVAALKTAETEPLMSEPEARRAVRTARGDMEDINIGGDAGDFTKGTVASAKMKGRTK